MRVTSHIRSKFVTLLLFVSGLLVCPYRLLDNAETWYDMFCDDHDSEFLLNGVTSGFTYAHTDIDPGGEFYVVPNYVDEAHWGKLDDWVESENNLGHYVKMPRELLRGVAALGAVDKDHSNFEKIRVVHDMSRPDGSSTNEGITYDKSSFPTVADAFALLRSYYYQAKVDLTAAYRSIVTASELWRFQGLHWRGVLYADTSLPFGIRAAPPVFNRITQAVVRRLRALGIKAVLGYIDDFWVCAPTENECLRAYDVVIQVLQDLGFDVNKKKCVTPTQRLIFLGIELDSNSDGKGRCEMRLPHDKRVLGMQLANEFLSIHMAGVRKLFRSSAYDRLVGYLAFCATVVFGGRLFMNYLYAGKRLCKGKFFSGIKDRGLVGLIRRDLLWWVKLLGAAASISVRAVLHRQCDSYCFFATDACTLWGMGGFLNGDWFAMSWEELMRTPSRPDWFPDLSDVKGKGHINYLELFAVYWALCKWGARLVGQCVVLNVDNTTALYNLARLKCRSVVFLPLLKAIMGLLLRYDLRIKLTYISTKANTLADTLSRNAMIEFARLLLEWERLGPLLGKDFEDWMLHTHLFKGLDEEFGPVAVSACADEHGRNSHTPRYWSAVDSCLLHAWAGLTIWVNPPFSMIWEILAHFLRCKLRHPVGTSVLFLVPLWFDTVWHRCIRAMPGSFQRVRLWKEGADLFTAPSHPNERQGRKFCGTTGWDVEVYYVSAKPLAEKVPDFFWAG